MTEVDMRDLYKRIIDRSYEYFKLFVRKVDMDVTGAVKINNECTKTLNIVLDIQRKLGGE
jgi:hypothetical protein